MVICFPYFTRTVIARLVVAIDVSYYIHLARPVVLNNSSRKLLVFCTQRGLTETEASYTQRRLTHRSLTGTEVSCAQRCLTRPYC